MVVNSDRKIAMFKMYLRSHERGTVITKGHKNRITRCYCDFFGFLFPVCFFAFKSCFRFCHKFLVPECFAKKVPEQISKQLWFKLFLVSVKNTKVLIWRDVCKVFEPNKKPENILRQSWIIHATFTLKQEQFKRTHETDNKVLRRLVRLILSSFFVLVFGSFKKQTEYCCKRQFTWVIFKYLKVSQVPSSTNDT